VGESGLLVTSTAVRPALAVTGSADFAAFKPGDHLRVRRLLYSHHGIYVGDGRVVQFGGGAGNKRHNRIEEVPFATFASGGLVELVDQSRLRWIGLWRLPPPFGPDQIVGRARCLVAHNADAAYNLIGRNCETVALWCACGMGESLQRQRFQAVNALLGVPFSLYISLLHRRQGGFTRRQLVVICGVVTLRVALLFAYYRHNRWFYEGARPCEHIGRGIPGRPVS
jgi:hypothetical protein